MASENSISRFPLDGSIVQRLDSLALLTRRPMASGRPGRRRSPLAGSSMDCSDSMYHGKPAKAPLATALAAAISYVALKCEDRVIVGALTDQLAAYRKAGSGKNAIWTVGEFLNRLPRSGTTDLNRALYDLGRIVSGPGLTIVISDFLAPGGYQTGIRAVRQL